jgi:hypothetical protein
VHQFSSFTLYDSPYTKPKSYVPLSVDEKAAPKNDSALPYIYTGRQQQAPQLQQLPTDVWRTARVSNPSDLMQRTPRKSNRLSADKSYQSLSSSQYSGDSSTSARSNKWSTNSSNAMQKGGEKAPGKAKSIWKKLQWQW